MLRLYSTTARGSYPDCIGEPRCNMPGIFVKHFFNLHQVMNLMLSIGDENLFEEELFKELTQLGSLQK